MKCPACGKDTRVSNSRPNENNTIIRRRRICTDANCGSRFSTVERLVLKCKVRNLKGTLESFDAVKLHRSVLLGLHDLPQPEQQAVADRVLDGIMADLSRSSSSTINSTELRIKVEEILRNIDEWLALRYRYTAPSPDRGRTIESLQGALFDADDDE